jgi:cysteine synthase
VTSILDAIGNTPIIRLGPCAPANGAELWLKLEYRNPTGSMKDRMALAMIEGAERDGLIGAGDTIVEYTGGSTGPALALVCREIWEQTEGRVTAFCQGMGTASSLMGVRSAQAAGRLHPGARAGELGRDQRRRARAFPHPGLDRLRDAALGSGPRRPPRADR